MRFREAQHSPSSGCYSNTHKLCCQPNICFQFRAQLQQKCSIVHNDLLATDSAAGSPNGERFPVSLRSLSLQLYSVRDALNDDIPGTLARVADIGFTQVEASYKVLSRGPELLDAIRANKLAAPTMTSPLLDGVDRDHVFATANELGASVVIETFLPEPLWTSADDVSRIADELNSAAEKAASYGLRVGYHNHWWELERKFEGMTALDFLASRLAPEVVFEIDAYWVAVGGTDPVDFITRHAERVRFLHLKDGPVNRTNTEQRPAGQGSMPLLDVVAATPNLEAGVIEFDAYDGDVFDAVAQSFAYLAPRVSA